jgi:oxygen-independent coproporphyrinogen-3 oxidase
MLEYPVRPTPVATFGVTPELLRKYDQPGPRYTSYPTAVEFHPAFNTDEYARHLDAASERASAPLSLYVHLPFCEERCTFCGCSVVATKRREVAARYIAYLDKELALVSARLGRRRRVMQYHWGGGTPTYLSSTQMAFLDRAVRRHFDVERGAEIAVEIDPRHTSVEQLTVLRRMGVNRLSLGVQDFSSDVQQAIGRIQSEAQTWEVF